MSHTGHGGAQGELPKGSDLAQTYWMFAGTAIAVATLVNILDRVICWQRLRSAAKGDIDPAKPKFALARIWATATAVSREISNATPPILLPKYPQLNLPPLGRILLIVANICLVLALCFYRFNLSYNRTWEEIAIRCAWITLAQLPLVFLTAGKRNIVALMTGLSYERLNWIHRWIARCLFLTATLHMAYFLKDWDRFDYIKRKLQIDIISRRGLGAWCVLLWIIVSSFGPIRNIRYEFFAIQHFVSLVGFITMIMLHTPSYAHKWIWVPVAICLVERTVRALYFIYNNLAIFHPTKKNVSHTSNGLISCKATFTPLAGRATHVLIQNPPFTWSPGQHVQLACPTLLPFQIHPFTIASLPSDNKLELIIRAHRGATGRIAKHANTRLPPVEETLVVLDGPYGRIRPLEQFDTVVLIAGSTGATFTMPLLRDLVRRWDLVRRGEAQGLATRRVKFVWVIKNRSQVGWFAEELRHVYQCLNEEASRERTTVKLSLAVNLYVTCDDVIQLLTTGAGANLGSKGETKSGAVSVTEIEHAPKEVGDTKSISGSVGGDSSSTEKDNCEEEVCCCEETATIADEDAIVPMSGNGSGSGSTTTTTTLRRKRCACRNTFPPTPEGKDDAEEFTTIQHSLGIPEEIHVLSGRPAIRLLINKELERARGESAVVACGPAGLVGYVRESVVGLSDERAACKGTGAQGIYLHTEAFGW